ncbi:MAG: tyrosine-type recombinase/integrase [Anaerolineae bacterium]|nr:tyrosine-type recombinase/integrase [Anaerolineae bacterium]
MQNSIPTLSVSDCETLLTSLDPHAYTQKKALQGIRNKTIALIMLEAGLRVGEVVKLIVSDLYFNSVPVMTITIREEIAKNKRERQIPCSTRLQAALKNYRAYFIVPHDESEPCFYKYRKGKVHPLTTRQIERAITDAAIRSLGRPVHPHVLRHTFATRLMRVTGIRTVQELLGHSDITSTQIYTHPDMDDKKKAIEAMTQNPTPPTQSFPSHLLPPLI